MKEKRVLQDRLPTIIKQRRSLEETLARLEGTVPERVPSPPLEKQSRVIRNTSHPTAPKLVKPPQPLQIPSPKRIIRF